MREGTDERTKEWRRRRRVGEFNGTLASPEILSPTPSHKSTTWEGGPKRRKDEDLLPPPDRIKADVVST